MRAIDADALIEDLGKWMKEVDPTHPSEIPPMDDIIISTLMTIDEQPTIEPQRWIPVSERLPEEGQACLVADKGSITIDTYIGHGNPYNWRWYVRDYEAWQPLPEPYQSET